MKKTLAAILACICAFAAFTVAVHAAETPIYYSDHGAIGDGVTDDFDAIIAAHEAANAVGLSVKADPGAVYYIGNSDKTAIIQTDTDWGNATFILDDAARTTNSLIPAFSVTSAFAPVPVTGVDTLRINQAKFNWPLGIDAYVRAIDTTTTHYIRDEGDSKGEAQSDAFLVGKDGSVDPNTPIIWDFDNITSLTAYPIDPATLTVRGGHFISILNQSNAPYTTRNIFVKRSNVVIDGVSHSLERVSTTTGAYFNGFFQIESCANVTVQNATVVGHRPFYGIDAYEFLIQHALNVTIKNCRQSNGVNDDLKPITGTNQCKNLVFDTVELNRVDAHKFVTNLTVRNSLIGHSGIAATGRGTLLVENTEIRSDNAMITLRGDYGATWGGEIVIRDCVYVPQKGDAVLINGTHNRNHDFGYPLGLPRKVTIDGLVIDDSSHKFFYLGPKIFNLGQYVLTNLFRNPNPYALTEEIAIRNVEVKSGRPLLLSNDIFALRGWFFPNVKVTTI